MQVHQTTQLNNNEGNPGWGDQMGQKQPNMICILLQNIGGINLTETRSFKLSALQDFSQQVHVDIIALMECNIAWDKVEHNVQLKEQTKFWWENVQWCMAYNRHESRHEAYQQEELH